MALPQVIKRGLSTSSAMSAVIKNVTVIGGGLMGSGIAQVSKNIRPLHPLSSKNSHHFSNLTSLFPDTKI
jgi:hypothetical protein